MPVHLGTAARRQQRRVRAAVARVQTRSRLAGVAGKVVMPVLVPVLVLVLVLLLVLLLVL